MDPNDASEQYGLIRQATDRWQGQMLAQPVGLDAQGRPAFTVGGGTEADPAMVPETVVTPPGQEPKKQIEVPLPDQAAAAEKIKGETQPKQGLEAIFDSLAVPQEVTLGALSGKGLQRMTSEEFVNQHVPGGVDAFLAKMQEVSGGDTLGPALLTLPVMATEMLLDPLNLVGGAGAGTAVDAAWFASRYAKLQEQGVKLNKAQKSKFEEAVKILQDERGSIQLGGKGKAAAEPSKTTTPTWEEAVQIDEHQRAFDDRLKTFSDRLSTQRRGVVSDVEVSVKAQQLQQDRLNLEGLLQLKPGTILNVEEVTAVKRMFKETAEPVRQLAQYVTKNPGDQQAFLALLKQLGNVDDSLTKIAGVYAESGRTQRVLRQDLPTGGLIPAKSPERVRISDDYLQQWLAFFQQQQELDKMGANAMTKEKFISAISAMKSPEELAAVAKIATKPKLWDMFMEYWINGLLSGPQTHATNIMSNAATLAYAIPERLAASMFTRYIHPTEATAMISGVTESIGDAFRLAWKAFRTGESQMGLSKLETRRMAITADALELTGPMGRAVDMLGTMVRLPGNALTAADDFFKSIAFRAELRALARRTAFQEINAEKLTGKEAATRMAEIESRILADPPESIHDAAKEFAAYTTFNRELGEQGQKFQEALQTPIGRIVVPFVRTPTNIFKYFGERTPLAFASQAVRDEINAGGVRRAQALAKIGLGSSVMAYFGSLAAQGYVSGGGPKDKRLLNELKQTGWQPYSFKIGNEWVKYGRLEPIGSIVGLAADAADLMGQLPQKDAEELAAALVVAVSRNMSQKTFVMGLAGTLNAVASQDINVVNTFLEKELPTLLPASTLLAQTTRQMDPVQREVNSIMDAFKARVPGYSDTLPPRRNLFGEPIVLQGGIGPDMISPLYTSKVTDDKVAEELVRLELPLSLPSKQLNGVPLEPDEYDAYQVLAGQKPILHDQNLHEAMAAMMKSDLYKRSSDGQDGGRAVLLREIVSDYRDRARYILSDKDESRRWLGKDFPDLRQQLDLADQDKRQMFDAPAKQPLTIK